MPELSAANVVTAARSIEQEDLSRFEHNGCDLVIGQMVADFGFTRSVLMTTLPSEWARVSDVLTALLERQPFRDSPRYSGPRILLGAFATELRSYAAAAGASVNVVDLRAPEVTAGEREARQRALMTNAS